MTDPHDPVAEHPSLVPERGFSEFRVGETFALPSRTMTEAHFSAFQAVSGDNHPSHYDLEYCRQQGHPHLLAHGLHVLSCTAAGAGLFPHVAGSSMKGFIEQSSRFLAPVYVGDTLYPVLEVTELRRQRTTGVIVLGVTVKNQSGTVVLEGSQSYLVGL